jgi:NADPH:quinone reductase-like Zn-dependent oxidoreductase
MPGFLSEEALAAGPRVLGWDVSGVVEQAGLGVTLHKPGDEVFGMLNYPHGHGAAAEYVVAPARTVTRKPERISHEQAAAVPLAALTAWQALVDTADVQRGQRVLVHAAAGGVGHFAVQIAKSRGAYVIGTATGPKHEIVRSLGADEMIDYTKEDYASAVRDLDVVIDAIGGDDVARSLATLRPGGVVISLRLGNTHHLPDQAAAVKGRHELLLVESDQAGLRAIAGLLASGDLKPIIAAAFPLDRGPEAHALGDTGRVTGKIVLTV